MLLGWRGRGGYNIGAISCIGLVLKFVGQAADVCTTVVLTQCKTHMHTQICKRERERKRKRGVKWMFPL